MKLTTWVRDNWSFIAIAVISSILVLLVSFLNLESITNSQLSQPEITTLESSRSIRAIADKPLYAPFNIIEFLAIKVSSNSIYIYRAVAATFGVISIFIFYKLTHYWFSPLLAWLGTAMFATSSLYLHHARLSVSAMLVPLSLLGLLWAVWYLRQTSFSNLSVLLLAVLLFASLYIPGFIWFALLSIALQRRHIQQALKAISPPIAIAGFLVSLATLAPLIRSFVLDPQIMLEWAAIPSNISFSDFLTNLINVPLALTVRAPLDPVFNLGRLPYLDVFTIAMATLGAYAFIIRLQLVRTRMLAISSLISWILIATGTISIVVFLPVIYILATGGIMFLLQQWYSVFPKNPIARSIGLSLLIITVSISIFYNLNRYFIAWPHNPSTVESFQETAPPNLIQ